MALTILPKEVRRTVMEKSCEPEALAVARAALTACELLLLELSERGVLSESATQGVLEDAANAHRSAAEDDIGQKKESHIVAAKILDHLAAGRNSVHLKREKVKP